MERSTPRTTRPTLTPPVDADAPPLLPSRDFAHAALTAALASDDANEPALFVLTGDAGSGKSWLWRKIAAEQPYPWRWIDVDIVPSDQPEKVHRKIASALGIAGGSREAWVEFLKERLRDGERYVLAIEEAHNLTPDLLEEVRAASGLGAFGLVLLVGQTSLARRLATPALRPFVSRVSAAVHLPPVDADEAQVLLDETCGEGRFSIDEVEALHAESRGEPRRLLRLARARRPALSKAVDEIGRPAAAPRRAEVPERSQPAFAKAPLLGPGRPPLRVEDGLIEVGWNPDLDEAEDGAEPLANDHAEVRAEPGTEYAPTGPHFARRPSPEDRDY